MLLPYKNRQRHRIHPDLDALYMIGALPFINGSWYFVDPENGANTRTGESVEEALADIQTAYGKCTTGDGDGIALISSGTTTAHTTSYQTFPLTWSKNGITVFGVASPTKMGGRARVASKSVETGALTVLAFPTTKTITRSTGSFLTNGFEVGDTITVDAINATNDGNYIVTGVTATTLTCSAATFTVQTAAVAGSTTIVNYLTDVLVVSGDNNTFINVHIANYESSALSLGGVQVSGERNSFVNCHMIGSCHSTPSAEIGAYSLKLDGASENTFYGCVIGTSTIAKEAANGEILYDSGARHNHFIDCEVYTSSTTIGKAAIKSVDAGSIIGIEVFTRCRFMNFKGNGMSALTVAFIGTGPTSGYILMDSCSLVGYAAWAAGTTVYVANSDATAAAGGGIATHV